MSDERTLGERLFAVKVKINELKRGLIHAEHVDDHSDEKIMTPRAVRAAVRAALAEIEREL